MVTYFDIHSLGHNYTITQAAGRAAPAPSGWHNNKVRITSLTLSLLTALLCSYIQLLTIQ